MKPQVVILVDIIKCLHKYCDCQKLSFYSPDTNKVLAKAYIVGINWMQLCSKQYKILFMCIVYSMRLEN